MTVEEDPKQEDIEQKPKKPRSKKKKKNKSESEAKISADSDHKEKSSGRTHRQEMQERERRRREEDEESNLEDSRILEEGPGAFSEGGIIMANTTTGPAALSGTIVVGDEDVDAAGDDDDDAKTANDDKPSPVFSVSNSDSKQKVQSAADSEPVLLEAHLVTHPEKTKEEIQQEIKQQAPVAEPVPKKEGLAQEVPMWACLAGCVCCAGCLQCLEACLEALLGSG